MITAGIDAGYECVKAVIVKDGEGISHSVHAYGYRTSVAEAVQSCLTEALKNAGMSEKQLDRIAAIGSYREAATFDHVDLSEIICAARGSAQILPSVRTVIDLGAFKSVVLRCQNGNVMRVSRSQKCATGTSRYLAAVNKVLSVDEAEAGRLALQSETPVGIVSTCTVFAESEVISLVHQGQRREDILAGAFEALASRIYSLLVGVGFEEDIVMIGGLAGNVGIVNALEEQIGVGIRVPNHPIMAAALGAGLLAGEEDA